MCVCVYGKVDISNTYNGFRSNISFFIQGRTSSDSLNKEQNITKPVVSIDLSTFPLIFIILSDSSNLPFLSLSLYIYIYKQSKVFGHAPKSLFLILKLLFLMKQVKHHNVFIYYTKYKSS